MNTKSHLKKLLPFILMPHMLQAQSGTWTQLIAGDASGSWQTPGNWASSIIASGSGNTADFSTLDISVNSTVTLNAAVTIGNILFGDTDITSAASWTLAGPSNLTLAGATPTITVGPLGTGANANISAQITGASTFTKNGTGNLLLSGANNFTGAVTVDSGFLTVGNASALGTLAGNTTVNSGATLNLNGFNVGGESIRITGTGVSGLGALVNNAVPNAGGVRLELLGDATIGGTGRIDTSFSGTVFNGNNHTLTKTGSGLFVLNTGTITNMGNVDIQQGIISLTNNTSTLSSGIYSISIASGAAFTLFHNSGGAMTVDREVILANNATYRTSSSLLATTHSGNITLSGGTANIESIVNSPLHENNFIISGNISGAGGFNKLGAANLSLTGTNTYAGPTTVSAGTLTVNSGSLPGNVTNNAALVFNQTAAGTYSGVISGTGTVQKTGAGNLTLSGANTFSGAVNVTQGLLVLDNNSALGTTAGNTTVASGAALDINGRNVGGETIRISGTGIASTGALVNSSGSPSAGQGNFALELLADATVGGTGRMDTVFSGTAITSNGFALTKTGTNSFVINSSTTLETLNVDQGSVIAVNNASALGNNTSSANVASGASLQLFNSTLSSITHDKPITLANNAELAGTTATSLNIASGPVTLSGGTANIRVESSGTGTLVLTGTVSGTGGINKTSAGTLVLEGVNTYTGNTTISGGSLTLADNAELRFNIGASAVNNAILAATSGVGNVFLDGDFRFDLTSAGTTPGDSWQIVDIANLSSVAFGSTFQVFSTMGSFTNSGPLWFITENGVDYEFSQTTGILTVLIPEPQSMTLATLILLSCLLFLKKRLRTKKS